MIKTELNISRKFKWPFVNALFPYICLIRTNDNWRIVMFISFNFPNEIKLSKSHQCNNTYYKCSTQRNHKEIASIAICTHLVAGQVEGTTQAKEVSSTDFPDVIPCFLQFPLRGRCWSSDVSAQVVAWYTRLHQLDFLQQQWTPTINGATPMTSLGICTVMPT